MVIQHSAALSSFLPTRCEWLQKFVSFILSIHSVTLNSWEILRSWRCAHYSCSVCQDIYSLSHPDSNWALILMSCSRWVSLQFPMPTLLGKTLALRWWHSRSASPHLHKTWKTLLFACRSFVFSLQLVAIGSLLLSLSHFSPLPFPSPLKWDMAYVLALLCYHMRGEFKIL